MESLGMKINKSQLARDLNVDRRTIDKYLNGLIPKKTRKRGSKIDKYYDVIKREDLSFTVFLMLLNAFDPCSCNIIIISVICVKR